MTSESAGVLSLRNKYLCTGDTSWVPSKSIFWGTFYLEIVPGPTSLGSFLRGFLPSISHFKCQTWPQIASSWASDQAVETGSHTLLWFSVNLSK